MRFHVVHKLVSYLLVASALGALVTTGTVPLPTLLLIVLCAGGSWWAEPGSRLGRWLERAAPALNLGALAFFAVCLFEVVRSFPEPDLTPILNLVLFLLVFKLFWRRANRDYVQLYVLTFLVVMAAAWLAQSVVFVGAFAVYVVVSTWTLILFHLRHEIEDNYLVKHLPESATEKVTAARVLNSRRVVGRPFFVATAVVALVVLSGAALVFATVPRIGLGFLTGAVRRRMHIVGFSDEVMLGQHGVISRNNETVVLRAEVPSIAALRDDGERERAISGLYWRGLTFDHYRLVSDPEGGPAQMLKWARTEHDRTRTRLSSLPTGKASRYILGAPEEPARGETAYARAQRVLAGAEWQKIQVVNLSTPVAFALDRPVAFEVIPPPTGAFVTTDFAPRHSGDVALRPVRWRGAESITLPEFNGGQYIAYSQLAPPRPGTGVPISEMSAEQLEPYLHVPHTVSQRVRDLARRITGSRALPMAKVNAVTEWLRNTHGYTTDLRRNPQVADPLEDFLFHQSAGHCEYFATAAAVLLRLAGLPTRYVNGFVGGEWNELGKHITVRDNRAHSWIEVYLGTFGWVRIDATPAAARTTRMGRLRQVYDSMELFWTRWIIQYDASRQIDIARRLGRKLGVERGRNAPPLRPDWRALAVAAAVVAALWGLREWRRRTRPGPFAARPRIPRRGPPVFRLYQRTLDRLADLGLPRGASETPAEYAARVAQAGVPGAEALLALTDAYEAARYGGREVPAERLAVLEAAADTVGRGALPARAGVRAA